jgi:uncharacterized membrane protein (DUF106 family)
MDTKKMIELQKQLDENEKKYKETEQQIRYQLEKYKNENMLNCDGVKEELTPLDLSPQQINFICSNEIIYKYLPRTLEEEQTEPVYVTQIFKTMFTQPSVWIDSTYEDTIRRTEQINKYFITQL